MNSTIHWKGNMQFEAQGSASGHRIILDAAESVGGENKGARPMEVLLHAVGVCTGIDVVNILKKMRLNLEDFEMEVSGNRAEDHPRRFTKIHIAYRFQGDLPEDKVRRAVALSKEKYCSVSHSLNAEITYDIALNGQPLT